MDRIERHDIINALMLALALLAMAFLLSFFARRLFTTVGEEELVISTSSEDAESVVVSSTTSTTEQTTTTAEEVTLRAPAEVKVIVVNAARVSGIAGQGSDILAPLGYQMLRATNSNTVAESVVLYAEGFEADAAQVALLLNMGETAIAPMSESPGFATGDAHLAAILGKNQSLR